MANRGIELSFRNIGNRRDKKFELRRSASYYMSQFDNPLRPSSSLYSPVRKRLRRRIGIMAAQLDKALDEPDQ
jgi:hypothetical protein